MTEFDDAFAMINQDDTGYIPEGYPEHGDVIFYTFPCSDTHMACGFGSFTEHEMKVYQHRRYKRWKTKVKGNDKQ